MNPGCGGTWGWLGAARRGPDGGRGATVRRPPDRTRRRGGLSAGSAEHLAEEGKGGQNTVFGLQEDADSRDELPVCGEESE